MGAKLSGSTQCYNCAGRDRVLKPSAQGEVCSRCGAPKNGRVETAAESKTTERVTSLPVSRIHVVAVKETLPEEMSESALLDNYLRPYLEQDLMGKFVSNGERLKIKGAEFLVRHVVPAPGVVNTSTSIRCIEAPVSTAQRCLRLHVLPLKASLPASGRIDGGELFGRHIKPHVTASPQVSLGETFVSNGVQLRIAAAEPNGSTVDAQTEIFAEGNPLDDLSRLRILPIYETLPNQDKSLPPTGIYDKYLAPFFDGRFKFVVKGQEISIDGVSFKIMNCEPECGIVTRNTFVDNEGVALRADELKTQQEDADAALARSMQQQEAVAMPMELQARLQAILHQLPPQDPRRILIQRLHDRIAMIPMLSQSAGNSQALLELLRANGQPQDGGTGCSKSEIECLPTRKWSIRDNSELKNPEQATCMVCLSDYAFDEELRTLPCFHSYHKDCIDTWLDKSRACPLCKHVIST